jgi:curved DNA-binding protein
MSADALTHIEARAILGLAPDAGPEALMGAFRTAAKLAHPDVPGGDADRFRRVLEAYRLLQSRPLLPAPADAPPTAAFVEVGPLVALRGGEAETILPNGRKARVRIPAGVRHGETLKVAKQPVSVRLAADEAMQARGSDLWVTAPVAASLLDEGGRAQVETPLGVKVLWISRKIAERRLVRLEGQGLPARGSHPQGSLFIRLVPDTGLPESAARAQLKKFAAAWAA